MKRKQFIYIMNRYYQASRLLEIRNVMLQRQLSNPDIKFDEAMNKFYSATNFCDKICKNYELVDEILKKFPEKQQESLYLYIAKNKTSLSLAEARGISQRSFFREIEKISDRFMNLYNKRTVQNG